MPEPVPTTTVWLASERAATAHRDRDCRRLANRPSWCAPPIVGFGLPGEVAGFVNVRLPIALKTRDIRLCATCGQASEEG